MAITYDVTNNRLSFNVYCLTYENPDNPPTNYYEGGATTLERAATIAANIMAASCTTRGDLDTRTLDITILGGSTLNGPMPITLNYGGQPVVNWDYILFVKNDYTGLTGTLAANIGLARDGLIDELWCWVDGQNKYQDHLIEFNAVGEVDGLVGTWSLGVLSGPGLDNIVAEPDPAYTMVIGASVFAHTYEITITADDLVFTGTMLTNPDESIASISVTPEISNLDVDNSLDKWKFMVYLLQWPLGSYSITDGVLTIDFPEPGDGFGEGWMLGPFPKDAHDGSHTVPENSMRHVIAHGGNYGRENAMMLENICHRIEHLAFYHAYGAYEGWKGELEDWKRTAPTMDYFLLNPFSYFFFDGDKVVHPGDTREVPSGVGSVHEGPNSLWDSSAWHGNQWRLTWPTRPYYSNGDEHVDGNAYHRDQGWPVWTNARGWLADDIQNAIKKQDQSYVDRICDYSVCEWNKGTISPLADESGSTDYNWLMWWMWHFPKGRGYTNYRCRDGTYRTLVDNVWVYSYLYRDLDLIHHPYTTIFESTLTDTPSEDGYIEGRSAVSYADARDTAYVTDYVGDARNLNLYFDTTAGAYRVSRAYLAFDNDPTIFTEHTSFTHVANFLSMLTLYTPGYLHNLTSIPESFYRFGPPGAQGIPDLTLALYPCAWLSPLAENLAYNHALATSVIDSTSPISSAPLVPGSFANSLYFYNSCKTHYTSGVWRFVLTISEFEGDTPSVGISKWMDLVIPSSREAEAMGGVMVPRAETTRTVRAYYQFM